MFLYDDDGLRYEVDEADCELEADGFWLLTEDGEDEEFYSFCDDVGDE